MNLIKKSAVDFQLQLNVDDAVALQKFLASAVVHKLKDYGVDSHETLCATISEKEVESLGRITITIA